MYFFAWDVIWLISGKQTNPVDDIFFQKLGYLAMDQILPQKFHHLQPGSVPIYVHFTSDHRVSCSSQSLLRLALQNCIIGCSNTAHSVQTYSWWARGTDFPFHSEWFIQPLISSVIEQGCSVTQLMTEFIFWALPVIFFFGRVITNYADFTLS